MQGLTPQLVLSLREDHSLKALHIGAISGREGTTKTVKQAMKC